LFAAYLVDVFDLLNVRDLDLIEQAAELCSRLVVGVCSDDYAEQVLGRRTVVPAHERVTLVGHVRGVDEVMTHDLGTDLAPPPYPLMVAGDRPALLREHALILTPRRRTSSALLQNALLPNALRSIADEIVA